MKKRKQCLYAMKKVKTSYESFSAFAASEIGLYSQRQRLLILS